MSMKNVFVERISLDCSGSV